MSVNNNIKPPEVIAVDDNTDEVSCEGGGGALGHPVAWYKFDLNDMIECKYCDRMFVKKRAVKKYSA